uniref:Uncharacterized protein n=1 Tax=Anopheles dirus TaxID=7168 RepID=A0A182NY56_9DIPT
MKITIVAMLTVLVVAVSAAPYGPPKHYTHKGSHAVAAAHASAHTQSRVVHHVPKVKTHSFSVAHSSAHSFSHNVGFQKNVHGGYGHGGYGRK